MPRRLVVPVALFASLAAGIAAPASAGPAVVRHAAPGSAPIVTLRGSHGSNGDEFAYSVASSRNLIVVGVPGRRIGSEYRGEVLVYVRPKHGWSHLHGPTATLTASGSSRRIGSSVAISGATIVAAGSQQKGTTQTGAVYVFSKPRRGWSNSHHPAAVLRERHGTSSDGFGSYVAVSGATVAVTVTVTHNGKHRAVGAVDLFHRTRGGWGGHQLPGDRLTVTGNHGYQLKSVAMTDHAVVVGAANRQAIDHPMRGRAFVFAPASGRWGRTRHQTATLVSTRPAYDEALAVVAIAGKTVVVGSPTEGRRQPCAQGAGYVFVEPRAGWRGVVHQRALLLSRCTPPQLMGAAVAVVGGTVALGAPNASVGQQGSVGLARVFHRPAGGWSGTRRPVATVRPRHEKTDGNAGTALAIVHGGLLLGAPSPYYSAPYENSTAPGCAYLMRLP